MVVMEVGAGFGFGFGLTVAVVVVNFQLKDIKWKKLKNKQKIDQKIYAKHKMGWVEKMSSKNEKRK